MEGPLKLDIGCGVNVRPGFVGIDQLYGGCVYPLRWNDGTPIADGVADEIVASHILEHFSLWDTQAVVNEWVRALKPGGLLRVAVPNLWWIIDEMNRSNPDNLPLVQFLMGGQTNVFDYHKQVFTPDRLDHWLRGAGLTRIGNWSEPSWPDCSNFPCSLNMQGWKPE